VPVCKYGKNYILKCFFLENVIKQYFFNFLKFIFDINTLK
jgi:hypothetical protein